MVEPWRRTWILAFALSIVAAASSWCRGATPAQFVGTSTAETALYQAGGDSASGKVTLCETDRYRFRGWFREKIVCEKDLSRYGLKMDEGWELAPADRPVVILIHGFNSSPERNGALLIPIHEAGFPCGAFAYPNDHTIGTSAQLLSNELRQFAKRYPERCVVLVCHSMGGMVARACLEDALYDPGNVERLIMIAPPSHGSMIANFAIGTDLWEHWLSRKSGGPWARCRDSIVDGMGEAADELCPDSDFLHELNARPRNPRVRYSILLGTGALLSDAEIDWIRVSVCTELAKVPGGEGSADRLKLILDDIDELVDGKGDGVVAVKRGRLEGVSDTVTMPFGHLAVTGKADNDMLRSVQAAVLQRIQ